MNLSSYSEFGLLVAAIATKKGWLGPEWLIIIALSLTFSFLVAAPLNNKAISIYDRFAKFFHRFETKIRHKDDFGIDVGPSDVLIFGMGPFGFMAYETIRQRIAEKVIAIDYDKKIVTKLQRAGCRVIWGDATDYDFWNKIDFGKIKIIMLTMTRHQVNLSALQEIKSAGYQGPVTATARFEDERLELEAAGATSAYNIYAEAGAGYADHVCRATGLVCKTEFIVSGTEIPVLRNEV